MPWSGQSMYCKWVTSLDCRRGTYEGRGWTNSQYHDDYIATHETYKERMGNVLPLHWGCALIGILCWWQWTSFPQRAWRFDTEREMWTCLSNVSTNVTAPRQYTARVHTQCTEMATLVCANEMCMMYNAISIVHVRLEYNLNLFQCVPFPALWCLTNYLVWCLVCLQFSLV